MQHTSGLTISSAGSSPDEEPEPNPGAQDQDMLRRLQARYVEKKKKSDSDQGTGVANDLWAEMARLSALGKLEPGDRVLDVGCSLGAWTNLLDRAGYESHGLDFSPGLVEEARRRSEASGSGAIFTLGPAEAIPYPDGHFDAVICNYMLEHAADWESVVKEIGRVVRPGGVVYLGTVCAIYPFTDEVRLPLYPYYPRFVKRFAIRLALTRFPVLVGYSPTPAVNWLKPGDLKRAFTEAGLVDIHDAFDVVEPDHLKGVKRQMARVLLPVLRRVRFLKSLAYLGYPGLKFYAVRAQEDR